MLVKSPANQARIASTPTERWQSRRKEDAVRRRRVSRRGVGIAAVHRRDMPTSQLVDRVRTGSRNRETRAFELGRRRRQRSENVDAVLRRGGNEQRQIRWRRNGIDRHAQLADESLESSRRALQQHAGRAGPDDPEPVRNSRGP